MKLYKLSCVTSLVAITLFSLTSARAQTVTPLSFVAATSSYSNSLDRLILTSGTPDLLHVYNPANNSDATVALPDAPVSLVLSPDGLYAAVQHPSSISYINLQTRAVVKTFPITVGSQNSIVLGPTYLYVLTSFAGFQSVNLTTGAITTMAYTGAVASGTYNTATQSIYFCAQSDGLVKLDVSTGPVTGTTASPFSSAVGCGQLWSSSDFTRIYGSGGGIFNASTNPAVDMTYFSSLSLGTEEDFDQLALSSTANKIAYVDTLETGGDTVVRLADYNYLNPLGLINVPKFTVGSTAYAGHSLGVFLNSAGSNLFVLTQADGSAPLQNNQAIFSVPLQSPASCTVTLGATTASPAPTGGIYTTTITADPSCVYSATSNVDWIEFSALTYGSGSNTLTYQVRPNLAGSRSGVISVGSASLTVTQNGSDSPLEMSPLSFIPVAAGYSSLLDKLVLVAASPNELHLYDALTQADQIIALPAQPLSVSITPDGTHAAVGHNGSISYVNLQTAAIEKSFTVPTPVNNIAAAANGYLYTTSSFIVFSPSLIATDIATGVSTSSIQMAFFGQFTWPQVSPSSHYLYFNTAKFDISGSAPSLTDTTSGETLCWKYWISQDGNRIITSCGTILQTSDTPSFGLAELGQVALGSSGINLVNGAADSATQQQTAVITGTGFYDPTSGDPSVLEFYNDSTLALIKKQTLPSFLTGSTYYNGSAKYVFWSKDSSHLFVVTQEYMAPNVQGGFAVLAVSTAANPSSCSFQVTPPATSISGFGGIAVFNVTASAPTCSWSTDLGGSPYLSLISGSSGTGSGSVSINVPASGSSSSQKIPVSIAGQSVSFTQDQACSYVFNPSAGYFLAQGGDSQFSITVGPGCPWTATAQNGVTVTSAASGVGNGVISYSVSPNTTSAPVYTGIGLGPTTAAAVSVYVSNNPAPASLRFVPVTPCRVVDTRNATGQFGGPILAAGSSRSFPVPSSSCGIPSTAQAYALNVTAVPPGGISYLTVWPTGQYQPLASTLNSDGRVKAVAAIIPAGTSGAVSVFTTDPTHLVLDINGYFVPATEPTALAFYPLTPCRILDTRGAVGPLGGPSLGSGQTRTIPITSSACNIPATAAAYSLNYTVVPAVGLGYLASWPTGQPQPVVSTLNADHSPTANAGIVPAGSNGSIQVYASDATDLVLDIDGYFAPPASGGLSLYALTPCRVADTRVYGYPANGISATTSFIVSGTYPCYVPSNAQAFVTNVTVVPATPLGFLSIWGDGQSQPLVSTLNDWDAVVTSNMAIAPTQYGSVNLFPSNPTQVILDVSGYFAP